MDVKTGMQFSNREPMTIPLFRVFALVGLFMFLPQAHSQTGMVSEFGNQIRSIAGIYSNGPGYLENEKLFPVEVGGEFQFNPVAEFSTARGEVKAIYLLRPQPKVEGSWVEYAQVAVDVSVTAVRDLEGLYVVRAWIDDGKFTHVSFRPLPRIPARSKWSIKDSFTIRREQSKGFLWCGVFDQGKPMEPLGQGNKIKIHSRLRDAVMTAQDEVVAALLAEGASWKDLEDEDAEWMAMNGRLGELVQWTEAHRLWQRRNGPDLLWRAVATGRLEVVNWLLDQGVNPEKVNDNRVPILAVAMDARQWEMVPLLLRHREGNWSLHDEGNNPLLLAAVAGRTDLVNEMLSAGIKWPTDPGDFTVPLIQAVNRQSIEALQLLIEGGASFNTDSKSIMAMGSAPLSQAAAVDNLEIARILVGLKPDWKAIENRGFSPLHVAVAKDRLEIVKLYINDGADPMVMVMDGRSDLVSLALENGSVAVARYLIDRGVEQTKRKERSAYIWSRALGTQNTTVGEYLNEISYPLPEGPELVQALVEQAMAENYQPILQAVVMQGWTGSTPMRHGWNAAGLADYFGLSAPAELVQSDKLETGPVVVAPPEKLTVSSAVMPSYPEQLWINAEAGEAQVTLLIDESGSAHYVRVKEATQVEFGFAARRSAGTWKFSPMPDGQTGWRKVTIPMAFKPVMDAEDFVAIGEVDQIPVLLSAPELKPVENSSPDVRGAAFVSFIVGLEGEVLQSKVMTLTDPSWRDSVTDAVRNWRFQPAVDANRAVKTRIDYFVKFPSGGVIPEEGIAVNFDAESSMAVRTKSVPVPFAEGTREKGGMVLAELVVKTNGKPDDIRIVASSDDRLNENCLKTIRSWRFRPAQKNGSKIEQVVQIPIYFKALGK